MEKVSVTVPSDIDVAEPCHEQKSSLLTCVGGAGICLVLALTLACGGGSAACLSGISILVALALGGSGLT